MIHVNSSAGFLGRDGRVITPKTVTLTLNFEGIGDRSLGSMFVYLSVEQTRALAGKLLHEAARIEALKPAPWPPDDTETAGGSEPQGGDR